MKETHVRCQACNASESAREIIAKEMMFGFGGTFSYTECAICQSLTLQNKPENLGALYPADFYSFEERPNKFKVLKKIVKPVLAKIFLFRPTKTHGLPVPNYYSWLAKIAIKPTSKILDVGCGAGHLLMRLADDGLQNLTGIDPFIKESTVAGAVKLLQQDIFKTTGDFDVIIFDHSLEHVDCPGETLKKARALLAPHGSIIVRLPITNTYAFKTFGADWVQLDAPRHMWIPSLDGMKRLALRSGLTIQKHQFDSYTLQFWGSLQYKKGIALMAQNSYLKNPAQSMFSKKDIAGFEAHARELNICDDGDSATFYLQK